MGAATVDTIKSSYRQTDYEGLSYEDFLKWCERIKKFRGPNFRPEPFPWDLERKQRRAANKAQRQAKKRGRR